MRLFSPCVSRSAMAACGLFLLAARAWATLEDGLIAHLPLKTDLQDHSAQPLPVENSGAVELRGGAAWFSGDKSTLDLPFIPLHDRPFAVAVWLKPAGDGPTYGVLEQRDRNETNHILHLMIRDGLRPWLGFYVNDVVSPLSLSNGGEWQHVVFQYDGHQQEIWINGRLICRRTAIGYAGASGKTRLGRNPGWNNVPGTDYQGFMSDFRIYGRALAFPEIVALVAARPSPIRSVQPAAVAPRAPQPLGSVAPAGMSNQPLLAIDAEKMRVRGKPGDEYVVEASSDMVKWEVVGTVAVGADGLVDFADDDAKRFRQRFYRLKLRAIAKVP